MSGMVLVILSPALKDVLNALEAGERGGGVLFFSYFIGGTLSTLTISWLARLLPSLRILQASCILCGLSLWGFSCSHSQEGAALFFFFVGATNAILIAFPGALLAKEHGEKSGKSMSLLYTFFALGVMFCPFLSGFLLSQDVPWQKIFRGVALVCMGYSFSVSFGSLPSMKETEGLSWGSLQEARKGDRGLLLGAVFLNILYIGAETSVIGWVVYYLEKTFAGSTDVFRASRVLTYFWMAMIVGRVLTAFLVDRLGAFRMLFAMALGGLVVWTCAVASSELVLAEILFAFTGFFFSGIFPVIASFAGRFSGRHSGLAVSLILAGGGFGGAVVPALVGWIAQAGGIRLGQACALSSLVVLLTVLIFLKKRGAEV